MWTAISRLLGLSSSEPRPKPVKPDPISLEDLRALVLAEERPSLWLLPTDQPALSKLGGLPDIEEDVEWPEDPHDGVMGFVAQIDLAQARAAGGPEWLPGTGVLYFFANTESLCEGDGGRVLYSAHAPIGSQASRPGARVFPERGIRMEAHPSYPDSEWLNINERCRHLDEDELATMNDLLAGQPEEGGDHRFCGYPGAIQDGALAVACEFLARDEFSHAKGSVMRRTYKDPVAFDVLNKEATAKWRMLLQIDSDDGLEMNWGDWGRIWFFIREEDARAGDFSQVQFLIQFH